MNEGFVFYSYVAKPHNPGSIGLKKKNYLIANSQRKKVKIEILTKIHSLFLFLSCLSCPFHSSRTCISFWTHLYLVSSGSYRRSKVRRGEGRGVPDHTMMLLFSCMKYRPTRHDIWESSAKLIRASSRYTVVSRAIWRPLTTRSNGYFWKMFRYYIITI